MRRGESGEYGARRAGGEGGKREGRGNGEEAGMSEVG